MNRCCHEGRSSQKKPKKGGEKDMSNWKIGVRISVAFAVVIAISVVMSVFTYIHVRDIDQKAVVVSDNHVPSTVTLSHTILNIRNVEALLRQHIASSNQQEMSDLEARIQVLHDANSEAYKKYEALPSDDKENVLYAKVKQDRAAFWATLEEIRKVSRVGTPQSNQAALLAMNTQLTPIVLRYFDEIQAVVDYNNEGSITGMHEVRSAVSSTIRGTILGLILAVALAFAITVVVVRSITRPLALAVETLERVADGDLTATLDVDTKDEVGQMADALNRAVEKLNQTLQEVADSASNASSSSQQLAAASEAIATGAQEQASSLEETSASLEEITATVRQSADNAQQASQLATGSRDSAEQGQEVVSKAITAMSEINAASAKISDIISTIDEIAFQTNLLAVNAAVEAARAGDEGRGFAVVASEVRSLAQRSAVAAKEIKVLIQDSLRKVDAGSDLVNRSGETLQGIVGSVKRVTDIVSEMAAAASEQSTGIEQVNTAMTQMDQVTQSNSAQTEELSATAQSLSEQAAHLMELVSTFTLTNSGRSQRQAVRAHTQEQPVGASLVQSAKVNLVHNTLHPGGQNSSSSQSAQQRTAKAARAAAAAKPKTRTAGKTQNSAPSAVVIAAAQGASGGSDASFEEF